MKKKHHNNTPPLDHRRKMKHTLDGSSFNALMLIKSKCNNKEKDVTEDEINADDKQLLDWYYEAFHNKGRRGAKRKVLQGRTELQKTAYRNGSIDYIIGDDVPNLDKQTKEQIVGKIREMTD